YTTRRRGVRIRTLEAVSVCGGSLDAMGEDPRWPFRGWEAVGSGAIRVRDLRRFYFPVYPGVYIPRGVELSADQRSRASWLWSGRRGVVAGLSASAVLGAKWIQPGLPAELVHSNRRPPPMLTVHTNELCDGETQIADAMTATTPARTAFDIGRRSDLKVGVQRLDALMNATDLKVTDIEAVAERHPGVRGLRQLHRTL